MATHLYSWSPYLALALGLLAALAAFRSWQTWFGLTGVAMLIQVIGWTVLFLAFHVAEQGWNEEWQTAFVVGFYKGLLVALPYTILGSAVGGALVRLYRPQRGVPHV